MTKEDRRLEALRLAYDMVGRRGLMVDTQEVLKTAAALDAWLNGANIPDDWYPAALQAVA